MCDTTHAHITNIVNALQMFYVDVGRFPTNDESIQALLESPQGAAGWDGPYLYRLPIDAWGNSFVYVVSEVDENRVGVYSLGRDGVDNFGSVDDISSWAGYNRAL